MPFGQRGYIRQLETLGRFTEWQGVVTPGHPRRLLPHHRSPLGIGGGGSAAANCMIQSRVGSVHYSAINTDVYSLSAARAVNPWAVEVVPSGVRYVIEQAAPGAALAVTVARPPGGAPEALVI